MLLKESYDLLPTTISRNNDIISLTGALAVDRTKINRGREDTVGFPRVILRTLTSVIGWVYGRKIK